MGYPQGVGMPILFGGGWMPSSANLSVKTGTKPVRKLGGFNIGLSDVPV